MSHVSKNWGCLVTLNVFKYRRGQSLFILEQKSKERQKPNDPQIFDINSARITLFSPTPHLPPSHCVSLGQADFEGHHIRKPIFTCFFSRSKYRLMCKNCHFCQRGAFLQLSVYYHVILKPAPDYRR